MSAPRPDRLDLVLEQARAFVRERDWEQYHDPKNLAMAVASEAGELLAEYRWVPSQQADAWSHEPENRKRIGHEIADVAIALLLLCERIGLDPIEAMHEKLAHNHRKYPVSTSKGKAYPPPFGEAGPTR
jgi:NTP pyrophosphatase (non-canonical NTP hydrolase)